MSKRINILYLHGFNSSPQSMKAELTKIYFFENFPSVSFFCPQLASSPEAIIEQLTSLIVAESDEESLWYFIGSSLGGYFSTYLSEKYQSKAVLINPAVKPFELLAEYLGEQTNPYTGEVYSIEPQAIKTLKNIEQKFISKNNYLVMVQTGDEVLDYQEAVDKYCNCQIIVQQGGDHSFIDYSKMLPKIAMFFNL
ncbi:MAG: esterase YqiA [Colwellia sp.]|nr:esterase YqiA [Colwellia sp.]